MNTPQSLPRLMAAAALWVALGGASCGDAVTYSYVNVDVAIDRNTVSDTQRYLITSCEFQVTGVDNSVPFDLGCQENRVPYEVGRFQWTSKAGSGALQFLVQIFDGNHVLLGEGTSAPVTVAPGKVFQTSVLVKGVTPPGEPDAGVDAPSAADAGSDNAIGADATTPGDAALDTAAAQDASGDAASEAD